MTPGRWLLLAHQLPTRSSNARVKIWRRLQDVGAVVARNSVYVLPRTDQCREDFEWIRSEIVALGGQATVFAADALDRGAEEEMVAMFQKGREAAYGATRRQAERVAASVARKRRLSPTDRAALRRAARSLRQRFDSINRIDFFQAAGRPQAATVLDTLDRLADDRERAKPRPSAAPLAPASFRARRWVTRPRPGVDRMASAWLIRRHIDPKATFACVDRPSASDVPFDMYVGDFSHHGSRCTFETLALRFKLTDPAVTRIGQIVHDLDMKETRYAPPDAPAVGRLVEGLRRVHADDAVLLERGVEMFEALARAFEADSQPATARPRRRRETPKKL